MATATRVFVSVSRKTPYYDSAWESPDLIPPLALQVLKDNDFLSRDSAPTPLLVVTERWEREGWEQEGRGHVFVIFDIFNDSYDPPRAHLEGQNDLPVIMVSLTGKGKAWITDSEREIFVNESVRSVHESHGVGSRVPFVVDHANGNVPTYWFPRSMRIDGKPFCDGACDGQISNPQDHKEGCLARLAAGAGAGKNGEQEGHRVNNE